MLRAIQLVDCLLATSQLSTRTKDTVVTTRILEVRTLATTGGWEWLTAICDVATRVRRLLRAV